jgi:DNA-binding XRE family transcriptional regulator
VRYCDNGSIANADIDSIANPDFLFCRTWYDGWEQEEAGDMAESSIATEAYRQGAWFGPRLKELRAAKSLTQKALGDRAGMAQSKIAEYESGRYAPSWPTVLQLAMALGVATAEFQVPPSAEKESGRKS